jgi:hypothetical protein
MTMDDQPSEADIKEFQQLQEELADVSYIAIGRGISAWAQTEGHLVVIAALLLDTTTEKAGLVLYSINNFYTWLSIIGELFVMDPRAQALRPDWLDIAKRLKKLNDTRVRLAHHEVAPAKTVFDLLAVGIEDVDAFLPTLKPNRFDSRGKSRKHAPLQVDQLSGFIGDLAPVTEKIGDLLKKMGPIFIDPKRQLARILRQKRIEAHYIAGG